MKKAILIINLGSPNSPSIRDVRKYLAEFLMDKNVINIPWLFRFLLVRLIIVPFRAPKSAKAYAKIWDGKEFPLIKYTRLLKEKLEEKLNIRVDYAMRYTQNSITSKIDELVQTGAEVIYTVPLYPQHTLSTTVTATEVVKNANKKYPNLYIKNLNAFYNNRAYIEALGKVILKNVKLSQFDHLLFSYHGIPENHLKEINSQCKIDSKCCYVYNPAHRTCYRHHCIETTRLVADYIGLKEQQYSISFQSRLGKSKWLEPYTTNRIDELAHNKVKRLAVVTPAFVADCLETIEEIGIEAKKQFLNSGGKEFYLIPCLNDDDVWVNALSRMIKERFDI
jgi:ferrochelatase